MCSTCVFCYVSQMNVKPGHWIKRKALTKEKYDIINGLQTIYDISVVRISTSFHDCVSQFWSGSLYRTLCKRTGDMLSVFWRFVLLFAEVSNQHHHDHLAQPFSKRFDHRQASSMSHGPTRMNSCPPDAILETKHTRHMDKISHIIFRGHHSFQNGNYAIKKRQTAIKWLNENKKIGNVTWIWKSRERKEWRQREEAYVSQAEHADDYTGKRVHWRRKKKNDKEMMIIQQYHF